MLLCDDLGKSESRSGYLIELSRAGTGTGDDGREITSDSGDGDGVRDDGGPEAGGELSDSSTSPSPTSPVLSVSSSSAS
jgi:hypothetical protein